MATLHAMPVQPPPPVPGQILEAHTPPSAQLPQSSLPAQPLPITPQYCPPPCAVQVMGTQPGGPPQRFGMFPPPHTAPPGQSPQVSVPPQPSPMVPQNRPAIVSHVIGTHPVRTQTPPRHSSPFGHIPQSSGFPQPLPIVPQNRPPVAWQPTGVQVGPPTHWLFSQIQSDGQGSVHFSSPPHLSPISPQYCPPGGLHSAFTHDDPPAPPAPSGVPGPMGGGIAPPLPDVMMLASGEIVPPEPPLPPVPAPPRGRCGASVELHPIAEAWAIASATTPQSPTVRRRDRDIVPLSFRSC